MSIFLGAIKGSALGKYEKIDFLQGYYNLVYVGFTHKDALNNMMSKYIFYPNIYDEKKPKFEKLVKKNMEIIDKMIKADKSIFFEKFMILK
jgi:hypothetical protein